MFVVRMGDRAAECTEVGVIVTLDGLVEAGGEEDLAPTPILLGYLQTLAHVDAALEAAIRGDALGDIEAKWVGHCAMAFDSGATIDLGSHHIFHVRGLIDDLVIEHAIRPRKGLVVLETGVLRHLGADFTVRRLEDAGNLVLILPCGVYRSFDAITTSGVERALDLRFAEIGHALERVLDQFAGQGAACVVFVYEEAGSGVEEPVGAKYLYGDIVRVAIVQESGERRQVEAIRNEVQRLEVGHRPP